MTACVSYRMGRTNIACERKRNVKNTARVWLKRSVLLAAVLLLAAALGMALSGNRLMLVSCYDAEHVMGAMHAAGVCYLNQLEQCEQMKRMLDASQAGYSVEYARAYRHYQEDFDSAARQLKEKLEWAHKELVQLKAGGRVSVWSGYPLDEKFYEMLYTRAAERAYAYKTYTEKLSDMLMDEQASHDRIEEYRACLTAVVEADLQASASLYQLVSRALFDQREMQVEGYPDPQTLSAMTPEHQEELLYLSENDLKRLCLERLERFWQMEYQLGLLL